MRRLRLLILLFGAALTIPLVYFVLKTHHSIEQEELAELRYFAEQLFDEMEVELAVLIHTEEARSIEEYTYTYVPVDNGNGSSEESPLSEPPAQDYILGYIQNNPDGSFQTPLTEGMVSLPQILAVTVAELEAVNRAFNDKRSATPEEYLPSDMVRDWLTEDTPEPTVADRYLERQAQEQKAHLGQESRQVQELSEEEYNRALSNMQQNQRTDVDPVEAALMEMAALDSGANSGQDSNRDEYSSGSDAPPPSVYEQDASGLQDHNSMEDMSLTATGDLGATEGAERETAVDGSTAPETGDFRMRSQETPAQAEPVMTAEAAPPPEPESELSAPGGGRHEQPEVPESTARQGITELDLTTQVPDADDAQYQPQEQVQAEPRPQDEGPVADMEAEETALLSPIASSMDSSVGSSMDSPVDSFAMSHEEAPAPDNERTFFSDTSESPSADTSFLESETFQVEVDPMQSVLIDQNHIFIFRRIVIGNQIYRQGFVIKVTEFLDHLAQNHFSRQPMAQFTNLRLSVLDNGETAASLTAGADAQGSDFTISRHFPRPFSFLQATLTCDHIPRSQGRSTLTTMTAVLAAVTLLGLFAIHQSARVVEDHSQRRQGFVSSVTHELKTPLTNIRMYVEMLEHGMARDTEREQEYLRIIGSESGRLSRLINNVLEFSKLENRSRHLDLTQGDLSEVLRETETVMSEKIRQEGFTLTIQRQDIPPVHYNHEAMTQVLINLLENSLKFGKSSQFKDITIRVRPGNDSTTLVQVSDTGPGIPSHALNKIFDEFYRVESSLTRTTRGTGIGLALVRKLVAAMNGTVRADNNPGPGCTITITLPA